jgi:hypothetical protein
VTQQTKKVPEIMKGMLEQLRRHPNAARSSEADHVAMMVANIA